MTSTATPPGQRRPHRVARVSAAVASGLALVLVAGSGIGWAGLSRAQSGITTIDVTGQLGPRPAKETPTSGPYDPVNILVMGTDTRTGQGSGYGNAADTSSGNGHSDTTILVHLSADRSRVLAVSIPRDSMVVRPACSGGGTVTGMFNAAFASGGAACTIKAVEHLTGVYVDHYLVVDFTGFKSVVEALGGVQVCLKDAVNDPKSHLVLSAGEHVISGDQALAFARARETLGDGSDISRIGRQQEFLGSIVRSATDKGLLLNPPKLLSVLGAIASSLTTDPQLGSLDYEQELATSLSSLSPSQVTFVTVPWVPYPPDHNRIMWDPSKAPALWKAVRDDAPYPPKGSVPSGQKPLTIPPAQVRVKVLNGSGTPGQAKKAATQLKALGFLVVGTGNAATSDYATTTVLYAPAYSESARTLAFASKAATSQATGSGRTLTLVVGKDWSGTQAVTVPSKASTTTTKSAATQTCVN